MAMKESGSALVFRFKISGGYRLFAPGKYSTLPAWIYYFSSEIKNKVENNQSIINYIWTGR